MTPEAAIAQARGAKLLPVYLVAGEERMLRDEVVGALRAAALGTAIAAFNEDRFSAGETSADTVVMAARTAPMMAPRRFVLVRGAERWDGAEGSPSLDALADYATAPVASTCLVVVATKLDGRRRLSLAARKQGFLVGCDPLDSRELPGWVAKQCDRLGHPIAPETADLLASLIGSDLSAISDAIERLSLFVGPKQPIDEAAIGACVARIRTADTWAMVDAVGARSLGRALSTLADAYDPRDRGLPLLGALAWSVRQLARYQAAISAGAPADQAAKQAGVFQPYRARELAEKARTIPPNEVQRWLLVLAETDLALKSSRRPPDAILEDMVTRLCSRETSSARRASNTATTGKPI